MIDWILKPILTGLASKFLYPEVIHPALMKIWKSKEWKKTRELARRLVQLYNMDAGKGMTDEQKRNVVFTLIKSKMPDMKDNKIHAAIVMAVEAEKIK